MININNTDPKGRLPATLVRTLAIAGFGIIIIIGMFGSVAVAKNAPGALSSLAAAVTSLTSIFVPAGEKILVSVPSLTVNKGETFAISWEHVKKSVGGSYTFRYDCADGVSFTSPTPAGSEATVYCNTPFNFLNADNTITLTAVSTADRYVDVTLYIDFTPNGAAKPTVSGSTFLTIANVGATPTKPATPTRSATPISHTPAAGTPSSGVYVVGGSTATPSNPNGQTDLAVRIIEQGIVDKNTGVFTASSSPLRRTDTYRIAVRFAVENIGTKTSPQWTFAAVLPTYPSNNFVSPSQPALAPGDRMEYTLGFDSIADMDLATTTINIDPAGSLNEPSKANNLIHYLLKTSK